MREYLTITYIIIFITSMLFIFNFMGFQDTTRDIIDDILASVDVDEKTAQSISDAIEPSDPNVRSYALSAIKSYHSGKNNIAQLCDIYDKLYRDWVYVSDPHGEDYHAPASESVKLLRGDCDDYAILMSSLIESIGGGTRVVVASNSHSGHAYAEVYLTDNKYKVDDLIDSISIRYGYKVIHYTIEEHNGKTEYWLNLDWTASHPGGEYYKNTGDILAVYPNGYHERINFNP